MIMAWASRFPPEASNIFVCIISLYLNLGVGEIPAVFYFPSDMADATSRGINDTAAGPRSGTLNDFRLSS